MRGNRQEHIVETKKNKAEAKDAPTGRFIKKNQIIIAALTLLLGVAGYINFSGNRLDLSDGEAAPQDFENAESVLIDGDTDETNAAVANADGTALDEAAGEIYVQDIEAQENIVLNSDEENIGEAVLTSTNPTLSAASIKLNREQVRSKSKEFYLEIMNGDGMDAAAVQSATDAYMKLVDDMEKESEAEMLLLAKGFSNVIVSIGDETVDVALGCEVLSDPMRAQVEDIVCRKTGCRVDQIVITQIAE